MNEFRLEVALWRPLIYTAAYWMTTGWARHELFQRVHAGISVHTVYADLMHTKHVGTDQYFYASVLWLLCFRILPGEPQQNISTVLHEIKAGYRETRPPCTFTNLTLNMFCDSRDPPNKYVQLKGRAAECRHLGKELLKVWRRHMHPGNPQHVQVRMALEASVEVEDILDQYPRHPRLPRDVGEDLKTAIFKYLILFNALGKFYSSTAGLGLKLFNVTVKAHYLAHIGLLCVFMNPRLAWTYSGEDFMQHSKRLFSACTRGLKPQQISDKFLFNYSIAMHVMMCVGDAGLLR